MLRNIISRRCPLQRTLTLSHAPQQPPPSIPLVTMSEFIRNYNIINSKFRLDPSLLDAWGTLDKLWDSRPSETANQLPINVFETNQQVEIEAGVPGMQKDDIKVAVKDGTIEAKLF